MGLLSWVLIYILICTVLMGFIWINTLKYHKFKEEDMKIHNRYYMFRRNDQTSWVFWKMLLGAICFWWIKIPLVLSSVVYGYIRMKSLLWGMTNDEISNIKDKELLKKINTICRHVGMIFRLGFFVYIKDIKVDMSYEKYLGKDYEKDESKIKIVSYITNHTSLIDCAVIADRFALCFISRSNIKSYPLIGFLASCCGCIFVDRASKDNRGQSLEKLVEKQKKLYNGEDFVNVCLFAEGTTSNDLSLLTFKKGGFYANLPIKPMVIKFDAVNSFSIAMDVIDLLYSVLLDMCIPYKVVELYYLPSFQPNDYLYEVYGKEMINKGKEKWEIYAEAVRDIMSIGSGLPKSEGNYQMKREYLDFLRKGKIPEGI